MGSRLAPRYGGEERRVAERESSLNICQIAGSLHDWGGIERYVVYLSQALRERGHSCDIAAPTTSPLAEREEIRPVSVHRKFDHRAFARYLRIFREGGYDVIHSHFSPDFLLAGYAAKLALPNAKRVMTRHVALPWSARKAKSYSTLWPTIIPVSNAVRDVLEKSGVARDAMTVAKAGLPPLLPSHSRAETRRAMGLTDDQFAVGIFGRLAKEKGTDVLLKAAPLVEGIVVAVYGDGPEAEALVKLSSSLRLGGKVLFQGRVADVADQMASVDVVVIPSRWEEAFPYAALEAFSLGVPVIGARVGGIPETVVPQETGLLFEKEDHLGLASALTWLRDDNELRAKMGSNARKRFEEEFTLTAMGKRIEAVYLG
ncbi:glycosyltransferase family 1 protein [bacterium]|nr:MAG: glycosyltransferase family 1 protein [bacterium]